MTDLLTHVERHWKAQGRAHGPPATSLDIAAFEARYDVRLPVDLRQYFLALNGSELGRNGPMDELLLSFWHLSEIRPLSEEAPELRVRDGEHWFVIADHSTHVHAYVVRLSSDLGAQMPMAVLYNDVIIHVAPSFGAFLTGYVRGDLEMLFPDPTPEWTAKYRDRAI